MNYEMLGIPDQLGLQGIYRHPEPLGDVEDRQVNDFEGFSPAYQ